MKYPVLRLSALASVLGVVALSGCAGQPTNPALTALAPSRTVAMQREAAVGLAQPDTCSRLKSHPLDAAGGHIPIQECNGTEGKLTYGSNDAPEHTFWQVKSYSRNPGTSICGAGHGRKDWLYATVYLSAEQAKFEDAHQQSAFSNPNFSPSEKFTLYEYPTGRKYKLGSPNQQKQLVFASPFNGRAIQGQVNICFELASP